MQQAEQDERAILTTLLSLVRRAVGPELVLKQLCMLVVRILPGVRCSAYLGYEPELAWVFSQPEELAPPTITELRGHRAKELNLDRMGLLMITGERPLAAHESRLLERLASQATGVLAAALDRRQLSEQLAEKEVQVRHLEAESAWLFRALDLLAACSGVFDLMSIGRLFQPVLHDMLPAARLFVCLRGRRRRDPVAEEDWLLQDLEGYPLTLPLTEPLRELLGVTSQYNKALTFQDLAMTRFQGALPEVVGLTLAPLGFDQGVLVSAASGRFSCSPEQLRNFQIGASLFGCVRKLASLHQQTIDALDALQSSQTRLLQAEKMAAIGQVAAGVAHEMNTPLATVRLALEGASRQKSLPEGLRKTLDSAVVSIERCREIASELLRFSRQTRENQREPVDLLALLRRFASKVEGLALSLPNEKAQVQAVPAEVQQVVWSLLENAMLAVGGRDRPAIEVTLERVNEHWNVDVRDNGPGVPEELAEKIFDPFVTTRKMGEGPGLGLAVARQLARKMGGEVTYLPGEGGAHFRFQLPASSA